jgi:aspartyl protease
MTLRYSYKLFPLSRPAATLRGRWVRPRPFISVSVLGPAGVKPETGLLDTGADDTVFPEDVARAIGVDLSTAPTGTFSAAGMGSFPVRYAEVTLRIAGTGELREWKALVGFTAAPLRRPLLGFAGFLQFFTATFHGDREEVELVVNGLYPGT